MMIVLQTFVENLRYELMSVMELHACMCQSQIHNKMQKTLEFIY